MNETELIREDREEELETLRRTCRELEETVQALRESNVLWGKKYFAAGDSFTHGDFKYGKQEERGVAVYDEEWGMFKTYPWWIARRNHMTLVCDGINGSIMQVLFTFGIGLVFGTCRYLIKDCKYPGLALGHGLYDFLNEIVRIFVV